MPTFLLSGLCGAGGGLVRSLLGWARGRAKFQIKRVVESVIEGFVGGLVAPEPLSAAIAGYAASSAIGKVVRIAANTPKKG